MHVPGWDRWQWHCSSCGARGATWERPAGHLCGSCGHATQAQREEAILDLEVRTAAAPKTFFDVTVRHSVPGDAPRLAAAASTAGAVAKEAEGDKRRRYPDGRCPFRAVPLATETFGRHGRAALRHLRELARARAEALDEGGEHAASALLQRWACRLSCALQRANAERLRTSLGAERGGAELAAELAE